MFKLPAHVSSSRATATIACSKTRHLRILPRGSPWPKLIEQVRFSTEKSDTPNTSASKAATQASAINSLILDSPLSPEDANWFLDIGDEMERLLLTEWVHPPYVPPSYFHHPLTDEQRMLVLRIRDVVQRSVLLETVNGDPESLAAAWWLKMLRVRTLQVSDLQCRDKRSVRIHIFNSIFSRAVTSC